MTLKDFATDAGVEVFRCGPEWGGTYAYRTADCPNCSICGYRSEATLLKAWAADTFGTKTSAAFLKLLRRA